MEDNASPVIILPRRVPTALKTKLREELDKYMNLGVLGQVEEPTLWVSSLAIAKFISYEVTVQMTSIANFRKKVTSYCASSLSLSKQLISMLGVD